MYLLSSLVLHPSILNYSERRLAHRLDTFCDRHSVRAHRKIRLADIHKIRGSGISGDLFRYALQAHYDFLIVGDDERPLFAVEFDGPSHSAPLQASRDSKKDWLASRFGLPLIRLGPEALEVDDFDRFFSVLALRHLPGGGPLPSESECPLCGGSMTQKVGRFGPFLSCERYPECDGSRELTSQPKDLDSRRTRQRSEPIPDPNWQHSPDPNSPTHVSAWNLLAVWRESEELSVPPIDWSIFVGPFKAIRSAYLALPDWLQAILWGLGFSGSVLGIGYWLIRMAMP